MKNPYPDGEKAGAFIDTLRDAYAYGVHFLKDIPDAALDARILLTEAASVSLTAFLAEKDRRLSEQEKEKYLHYLERRKNREPVAYILEKQEFFGRAFLVTQDVLIPNQDTECLVEAALPVLKENDRILDLCTGSGCILLSLLAERQDTTGVGTDLSEKALLVAEQNASRLMLSERASFLQGDLYEALGVREEGDVFDVIVSNPPYIRTKVIETLEEEVRTYEPRMALDGGEDGLFFYRTIVKGAGKYLKKDGFLLLETGFDQGEEAALLLRENGFTDIRIIKDLNGLDRVVMGKNTERKSNV